MAHLDLYLAFTLGAVGSLHCLQMCGPIVLSYSLPLVSLSRRQQLVAHLSYNLGRIVTYAGLGAVAGSLGGAAGLLGKLAGVEHIVVITAGCLMILAGLFMSGLLPKGPLARGVLFQPASLLTRRVGVLVNSPKMTSKFLTGILLGFLPCGLVYAALLKAIESGTALAGVATMICFGFGTAWSLLVLGLFSSSVSHWLRKRANLFAFLGVTLMGVLLLYRGIVASMNQSHMHH